ncbi:hypothetical protein [Fredinandcohnia sp. 179-A 10B2 NHS]|uniref:hypothetical protein n=1 Tax=Fredinandcohnia sp. 179-A 10B2 NHS TaxID=3235176 RepID=UPI0039A1A439
MKRYWKIVTLCIVTVIVIGSFYIQSGMAADESIQIEFEKVSGNEDEVKKINMYGSYENGSIYKSLQISKKETISLENRSPLEQMISNINSPVFEKLIEAHKSFMRGKDTMPNYFYEDEGTLAYASIERDGYYETAKSSFDIEVLDKKSGETSTIQMDLPKSKKNSWIDVVDVQVVKGELKVFTQEFSNDDRNNDEFNVYTFNIKDNKLLSTELILTAPTVENGWSDIRIKNDYFSIRPEKYIFIEIMGYKDGSTQGEYEMAYESEVVSTDYAIYNVENNKLEKLVVPEELLEQVGAASIFGSTIFIPTHTATGLEVSQYDIETEKWGKVQKFDIVLSENGDESPYLKLMNGKVYAVQKIEKGHSLFIGDLKTGDILYEGKLKVKNSKADQKEYRLYIHEIEDIY